MCTMIEERTVHAIVLTGGRSSRMGGRHKPGIVLDGRSVIDRTVSALWSASPTAQVIIAGSDAGLSPSLRNKVTVVREDPPFSGPVAGVAAALDAIPPTEGIVLLLGGDTPFLSAATLAGILTAALAGTPVVSCLDSTGHLQYLCAAWQQQVLRAQVERLETPAGVPLRALFAGLSPQLVECDPDELRDIDTPEDLARAVTTSDGRPVPQTLLAAVEFFIEQYEGHPQVELSPQQTAAILDFARQVKYSSSAANPVVAAFLAGQLAGSQGAASVADALRAVLGLVGPAGQTGVVQEAVDYTTGGTDVGGPLGGEHEPG